MSDVDNKTKKRIKELEDALRTLLELHDSLVEDEQCDHSVGICWCADFDLIAHAEKILGVK